MTAVSAAMVAELERRGSITSTAVRDAFLSVPREHFVPDIAARDGVEAVYSVERALVTKTDASGVPISSASAPAIMAPMLENLALEPGMRVLEIGAGTGYNAALMSHIVGPRGRVTSVELDPALARSAGRALRAGGWRARVVTGDGHAGVPAGAPFDRIIATASFDTVPRPWFEQLRAGGLVELPLRLTDSTGLQLVTTLRKDTRLLTSTAIVPGGFMAARAHPGDPGPTAPMIGFQERLDGTTPRAATLSGAAIGALSPTARGRAVGTLAGPMRQRMIRSSPDPWSMSLGLSTSGHSQVVTYTSATAFGVGLIDRAGSSLAILTRDRSVDSGGTTLLTWGSAVAFKQLDGVLDRWRALGRPGVDRLSVTITSGRAARAADAWWSERRGGTTIRIDW